jgi:hypothetical protein
LVASDVLSFDADGGGALFLLSGFVQDRYRVTVVQPVAYEAADGGHRGHGVPLRPFQ